MSRAGGDLAHISIIAVSGREYASEGTLDGLAYVSHPRQSSGPPRCGEPFVRVPVMTEPDVVIVVIGTGLLHFQKREGHFCPSPVRVLRFLMWDAASATWWGVPK